MKRKFLLSFTLILILSLIVVAFPGSVSYAQPPGTGWIKYSLNPVVPLGAGAQWDDGLVGAACVIEDAGTLKMWYSGYDGTQFLKIGYATSTDGGITWTKNAGNPVLSVGTGWEASGVGAPSVIKDGATYKMWYTGMDATNILRIGYATSTNGTTWTKNAGNPVLSVGTGWEASGVGAPSVILDGTTYKMWYTGRTGGGLGTLAIGYATSTNGTTWTKNAGNPVLSVGTGWEARGAGIACVIKIGGKYEMWYTGYAGVGAALSSAIGFASSEDGITWVKVTNAALSGAASWEIRGVASPWVSPDGKLMTYTGMDADLVARIGFAKRLQAQIQLTEEESTSDTVLLPAKVLAVKDPFTGSTLTKTVKTYRAAATYNPAGIEMLSVSAGDTPFTTPVVTIDNVTGATIFSQETAAGAAPPVAVGRPSARLVGSATVSYQLSVVMGLVDTDNQVIREQAAATLTLQRGDVKKTTPGTVDIVDAMFGAQEIVGLRPLSDINQLNMASVKHDDVAATTTVIEPDKRDIVDCMFIAQYVVGIRDTSFNLK